MHEAIVTATEDGGGVLYALALTPDGTHTQWVSRNVESLFGYPLAEVLAHDWWERHVHPDDLARARAGWASLLATGQLQHDYRVRRADGAYLWILDDLRLTVGDAPGHRTVHGSWTDITVRQRAADEAARRAALHALLLEHLDRAVIASDEHKQLIFANARAKEWFGGLPDPDVDDAAWSAQYGLLEMDGVTPLALERNPIVRAFGGDTFRGAEFRVAQRDAAPRFVRSNGGPLLGADGRPLGAMVVIEDVTEKRRTQAELTMRGAAIEAAIDAIVITDSTGAIVWANPAFEAISGRAASTMVGQPYRALLADDAGVTTRYADAARALDAGRSWRGEFEIARPGAERTPVAVTITPVVAADGVASTAVIVHRDLTDARRVQAQLLQAQRFASVARLAGGVAHDFNNQLTIISGMLELALVTLPPTDPLRADLGDARVACDRASGITRQLLAFSRQQILRLETADVNDVVRDTTKMLGRLLGDDVVLHLALSAAPPSVVVDTGQLQQVLINLAVNAREAMPRGGTVVISTDVVDAERPIDVVAGTIPPGRYVAIRIADDGHGFDESTGADLFDPFVTEKSVSHGAGLGLPMVLGIVTQSGGGITVASTPGQGSTFTILLPARALADAEPTPPSGVSTTNAPATILIVDDEAALRTVAGKILRRSGYQTLIAAGGDEALAVVEQHAGPIALLMTDVVMPGTNGVELARQLSLRFPAMQVLFTSGYTDDTLFRHGVDGQQVNFIAKPYSLDDLTRRVRSLLAQPSAPA